jgi:hypothetical protein
MDANVIDAADLSASITSETDMSAELKGTTYLATPSSTTATISSQTSKVNGVSTTTITITDAYGTKTDKIVVSDGATGATGATGPQGEVGPAGKDGASAKLTTTSIALSSAGWSNGAYSISNTAITANSLVYLSPAATTTKEMFEAMAAAEIIVIPADGSVELKALGTVPTIDIIANVVTVGV